MWFHALVALIVTGVMVWELVGMLQARGPGDKQRCNWGHWQALLLFIAMLSA